MDAVIKSKTIGGGNVESAAWSMSMSLGETESRTLAWASPESDPTTESVLLDIATSAPTLKVHNQWNHIFMKFEGIMIMIR